MKENTADNEFDFKMPIKIIILEKDQVISEQFAKCQERLGSEFAKHWFMSVHTWKDR